MVSNSDNNNKEENKKEDESTAAEKRSLEIPKVNFLGININLDTLATIGTILGLGAAIGTGYTIYQNWNQNKTPSTTDQQWQQQQAQARQQAMYDEYMRQELARRNAMQKQQQAPANDLVITPFEQPAPTTTHIHPTKRNLVNEDIGSILDQEKRVPVTFVPNIGSDNVMPHFTNNTSSVGNPNTMVDMNRYRSRPIVVNEEQEESEGEGPSLEELYNQANSSPSQSELY